MNKVSDFSQISNGSCISRSPIHQRDDVSFWGRSLEKHTILFILKYIFRNKKSKDTANKNKLLCDKYLSQIIINSVIKNYCGVANSFIININANSKGSLSQSYILLTTKKIMRKIRPCKL